MGLMVVPISLKDANKFVDKYHRHHKATRGHKFALCAGYGSEKLGVVAGVIIVGRPVSRHIHNDTLEVTRLCVKEGHPNACSFLLAAARRACKALGYKRLITYILEGESGISLQAAGFKMIYATKGGTWSRKDRERVDKHPLTRKHCYESFV